MHETDAHFFNVEHPANGATLPAGRHLLRGWLVPKPAHHFTDVRAWVGPAVFPGVHGLPRADLAAHFDPARACLLAEFNIALDLTPGIAVVRLEALDIAGRWQPFGVLSYQVESAAPARPPAPMVLRAHEFTRALSLWLKGKGDHRAETLTGEIPWPRAIREAHPPIYGYLDEPAASSSALYGRLHVLGWLFHEQQPLRRAFATTDLITLQPLEVGGEFTGVRQVFAGMQHATASRIFGFVDVPAQLPAPICVRIYGELADGSRHLCLAVRCRPTSTEELKAAYPVFSARQFWRGWRQLRQAWKQRGVPMEGGSKLWLETFDLWREYRRLAPPPPPLKPARLAAGGARAGAKPGQLLLISHNLNYEGAPLCLLELAGYFARQNGSRILLLTPKDGPLRAAYEEFGAEVRVIEGGTIDQSNRPAAIRRAVARLGRTISWSEIDLVVANTVVSFWGVRLAHQAGKRVLLYVHESTTPSSFFGTSYGRGVLPEVYAALRDADAVSFTALSAQAYYAGLRPDNRYLYTPGWIDVTAIDQYRSRHARTGIRARLGLREDETLVLNLGSVCDRKGQHIFVNAIELLWRRHPVLAARSRFLLVGARENDPYNEFLRTVVHDLGRSNIALVPETGRAYDYLYAADLFVCTSYEESFPRVVAEAMAFGLPIVASAVHGIPGMVQGEVEAILVPPGDTEALLTGLVRFLGALDEARRWGARARARVDRDFRTEVVLPLHSSLVSGLAAGSG